MLVSGVTEEVKDDDLRLIADCVISIKKDEESGELKIGVLKYRNSRHERGYHHMKIDEEGITVYPRIHPQRFLKSFELEKIPSGISELDEMMRGGIERGSVTIVGGPPGIGKSTLISHFIKTAAEMGNNSAIYLFDEKLEMMLKRCENTGIPMREMIKEGKVLIREIEPLEYTSEEFTHLVLKETEERDLKVVVIDSLDGYE
jgi:circadian clock protein KaiC